MKTFFEADDACVEVAQDKQGNKLLPTATLDFACSIHVEDKDGKWNFIRRDLEVSGLDAYTLLSLRNQIENVLGQAAFKEPLKAAYQRLKEEEE